MLYCIYTMIQKKAPLCLNFIIFMYTFFIVIVFKLVISFLIHNMNAPFLLHLLVSVVP